jgi:hypothetical protein
LKYKVAIIPGAFDEDEYDEITTVKEAVARSKILVAQDREVSLMIFSFDTEEEHKAFIQGYEAGVGYMGKGRHITEYTI